MPYFPMLKENAPRKGFVEYEQFERLYAALPVTLRPLVTFLYFTGCRLGEARKIQWSQIDLANRQVRLEGDQTKNGEPRVLPLPDQLVEMLSRQEPKSGTVFYSGQFRKSWITACIKAGLGQWEVNGGAKKRWDGLLVHDLRRSAVRNLIRAGVNERVAMEISGHKTRSVFDRYNIVSTDDLHRAMNRVEAARRVVDVPASPKQLPEGENNASLMKAGPIEESSQHVS